MINIFSIKNSRIRTLKHTKNLQRHVVLSLFLLFSGCITEGKGNIGEFSTAICAVCLVVSILCGAIVIFINDNNEQNRREAAGGVGAVSVILFLITFLTA